MTSADVFVEDWKDLLKGMFVIVRVEYDTKQSKAHDTSRVSKTIRERTISMVMNTDCVCVSAMIEMWCRQIQSHRSC